MAHLDATSRNESEYRWTDGMADNGRWCVHCLDASGRCNKIDDEASARVGGDMIGQRQAMVIVHGVLIQWG